MGTEAVWAGLIISAISTAASIEHQQDVTKYQVKQANADAETAKDAGQIEADKQRERAKRVAAKARAAIAASGLDVDSETANLINKDIITRGEEDAFTLSANAGDRASRLRQMADLYSAQGDQQTIQSVSNFGSSVISTGYQSGWYGSTG